MKELARVAAVFAVLAATPAWTQTPPPRPADVRRNAQEIIPDALIGAWKLDLSASKYAGNAPKMQYRLFDYTKDGKLLAHYITLSARDTQTSGNWTVSLDGAPGIEYTRPYASTPYAMVTLTKKDETTFDLTAARFGKVFETGTFQLSPDGNTLTFTYKTGNATNVAVYRRWNLLN